jgi:hypothetical protein
MENEEVQRSQILKVIKGGQRSAVCQKSVVIDPGEQGKRIVVQWDVDKDILILNIFHLLLSHTGWHALKEWILPWKVFFFFFW